VFFEAVLIPMYFIIGIWGGERRVYAAFKFFLYTLAGSVLMLIAIMVMVTEVGSSNMMDITGSTFTKEWQTWLWLAFFLSFAVKMPMWPVHTWLPDAHVEAPTAGSVSLAGVLLKMGGYGFIRFLLPMFPDASVMFAPLVYGLSLIAVVYTSLVALVQEDMKKLIAYSSIAHMAFVTMGIFTFNAQGLQGAMAQMVSHGLISSALFLSVGVIYDRMHTRQISFYSGLVSRMPRYAVLFVLFTMASIGLPGTSGFVAEFMVLLGTIHVSGWMTFCLATSMVLGAVYMLYLTRRIIFGKMLNADLSGIQDITLREKVTLIPLAVLVVFLGVYPKPLLKMTQPAVDMIVKEYAPTPQPQVTRAKE
jgi:NADH-quinone oxidoreductase subunit M